MADADDLKYETEDFSPRGVRWFTAGLAVLAVMVLVLMGALLWFLSGGRPPGQGSRHSQRTRAEYVAGAGSPGGIFP